MPLEKNLLGAILNFRVENQLCVLLIFAYPRDLSFGRTQKTKLLGGSSSESEAHTHFRFIPRVAKLRFPFECADHDFFLFATQIDFFPALVLVVFQTDFYC